MKRRKFDVNSWRDVETFKQFLITGSWGSQGCPFEWEFPYSSIPEMIKDKLVRKMLNM